MIGNLIINSCYFNILFFGLSVHLDFICSVPCKGVKVPSRSQVWPLFNWADYSPNNGQHIQSTDSGGKAAKLNSSRRASRVSFCIYAIFSLFGVVFLTIIGYFFQRINFAISKFESLCCFFLIPTLFIAFKVRLIIGTEILQGIHIT